MKKKPKTNKDRQSKFSDGQRAYGRKGRKVWATPEEHDHIKRFLRGLRENL